MTSTLGILAKGHPIYGKIVEFAFQKDCILEIYEMTDKQMLLALHIYYTQEVKDWKHMIYSNRYLWAVRDLKAVKERIQYLERLVVKTPPVTPQLTFF